jgi:hypothetical protein
VATLQIVLLVLGLGTLLTTQVTYNAYATRRRAETGKAGVPIVYWLGVVLGVGFLLAAFLLPKG